MSQDNNSGRFIGSLWNRVSKAGKKYLAISIDSHEEKDKYYKGKLLWVDNETDLCYKVKNVRVVKSNSSSENAPYGKIVIDLGDDYCVEQLDLG